MMFLAWIRNYYYYCIQDTEYWVMIKSKDNNLFMLIVPHNLFTGTRHLVCRGSEIILFGNKLFSTKILVFLAYVQPCLIIYVMLMNYLLNFRYPLAREGVWGPGGTAFLAHARQQFTYIVGLTALRLVLFMGYE